MSYRIQHSEDVDQAIRRIVGEQLDKAIREARDPKLSCHAAVHQVRKRCKKIRGAIRLVRPQFREYATENRSFRDAARDLSAIRDAQSRVEIVDSLVDHFKGQVDESVFAPVRARLTNRRDAFLDDEVELERRLGEFSARMHDARRRLDDWSIKNEGDAVWRGGLKKTYKRSRKAMQHAYAAPTAENFHEWRKRVKYHWYHARLLAAIWKPTLHVHRKAASQLSDLLGDDHDLAILRDTLTQTLTPDDPRDVQVVVGLIETRQLELRRRAYVLGQCVFAESPRPLVKRWKSYWRVWRSPNPHAKRHLLAASDTVPVTC